MEGHDATVRIAVVGDPGVGKTSLISAAASETFPDNPPPVLPPALLPADAIPDGVPVVITDTSSRPEDRGALEQSIREASVIVLCFAMDRPGTLARVSRHWMPEIKRITGPSSVPVLLVGCKADVRPADQSLQAAVLPIVHSNPSIETCMECSAKKLQYVGEVFYLALRAVVHPLAPLYDPQAQTLRPLCARALKRIFTLCDKDRDGVLSDAELNAFQVHCFNAPLQTEELVGVKEVVAARIDNGIRDGGLTMAGFVYLHALFVERGRLETTWAVLRRYGYNSDLVLSREALAAVPFAHAPDTVVELSEAGRAFFEGVFRRYDTDDDGVLSARELEELFSTAPGNPWDSPLYEGVLVETTKRGSMTLGGFLAKWAYTTAVEPEVVLAYALYLGLEDAAQAAPLFAHARPRRLDRRQDVAKRGLLRAFLFAAEGLDAVPLLEGLISQARAAHSLPSVPITAAVAAVQLPERAAAREEPEAAAAPAPASPSSAMLLLRPLAEEQGSVLLGSPNARAELAVADVAAFAFDARSRESFAAAVQRMLAVASAAGDNLPCLLVATQDAGMDPDLATEIGETCSRLGIAPPLTFAGLSFPGRSLYQTLVAAAAGAELAIPDTPSLQATRRRRSMVRRALWCSAGGVVLTVAGYAAYKAYARTQTEVAPTSKPASS